MTPQTRLFSSRRESSCCAVATRASGSKHLLCMDPSQTKGGRKKSHLPHPCGVPRRPATPKRLACLAPWFSYPTFYSNIVLPLRSVLHRDLSPTARRLVKLAKSVPRLPATMSTVSRECCRAWRAFSSSEMSLRLLASATNASAVDITSTAPLSVNPYNCCRVYGGLLNEWHRGAAQRIGRGWRGAGACRELLQNPWVVLHGRRREIGNARKKRT